MKIYSPNLEERAFLYQEVQVIEPMIKDMGTMTVMVEEAEHKEDTKKKLNTKFRVTMMLLPESMKMEIKTEGSNLYDAVIAAREEAVRKLSAVLNAMPSQDKSAGRLLH